MVYIIIQEITNAKKPVAINQMSSVGEEEQPEMET